MVTGPIFNPRIVDATPVDGNLEHAISSDWAAGIDLIQELVSRGHFLYVPTNAGWGVTVVNGGGVTQQPVQLVCDTNAAANAVALGFTFTQGLVIGAANAERIDWDKRLHLRCAFYVRDLGGDHSNSVYRIQLKEGVAEGALAAGGLGIRIDGVAAAPRDIIAESYGVSLAAVDTGEDVVNYESIWLDIIHTPGTSIVWKLNGVVVRTEVDTDKIPSGIAGASTALVISAINGASSGDGRMFGGHFFMWQES